MEAQAKSTKEQSNKNNIYDVGWQPSHAENGGEGKKKLHPLTVTVQRVCVTEKIFFWNSGLQTANSTFQTSNDYIAGNGSF